jgi:arsenite-transporting ATPase
MSADELVGLAGLNELITGGLVADAVGNPNIDVVVWDMGSTREALRTLQLIDTVPMLLDRLLTGPAAAQLSAPEPAALIAAWYRLVNHVAAARDEIHSATCVLVGEPSDAAELVAVAGVLRLYDCVTSAFIFNKVVSGKKTKAMSAAQDFGAPVVQLAYRDAGAPKVTKTATRLAPLCSLLKALPRNATPLWSVSPVKRGYSFTFPLRRGADVRVGRRGDALLIVCDGHRRQLDLPAVLKRCLISGGGMKGEALVLRFTPDPKVWRDTQ